MRTIAIINQKGGVAKSTTAHALGSLLALDGARVLFVDLDAQGNLTYALGGSEEGRDTYSVLTGAARASEALRTVSGGFSILGSSSRLSMADLTLTATGKEYRLKEALAEVSGSYDYAIIDTPPALGILTVNALTAADGAIIPAQADVFSLQGIAQLNNTLGTVRKYCNPALTVHGLLLTRFQRRAVISREIAEALEGTAASLGTRLFKAAIRECTAVKEAQASSMSLLDYAPACNAAIDYKDFYRELKEEILTK